MEGHHRGKRSITLHLTYNVFDLPFHHCKIIKLLHQRKDAGKLYTVSTLYLCFVLLWYYILLLLNLLSLLFFSSLPFSPFSLSFFPPFLSSSFFPPFPAKKYLFSREPRGGRDEGEGQTMYCACIFVVCRNVAKANTVFSSKPGTLELNNSEVGSYFTIDHRWRP